MERVAAEGPVQPETFSFGVGLYYELQDTVHCLTCADEAGEFGVVGGAPLGLVVATDGLAEGEHYWRYNI